MLKPARIGILGVLTLAVVLAAPPTYGDTLELKNGDIIKGTYAGGTQNTVRFSVDGSLQTYPVTELLALTFEGEQMSAVEPPPEPAPAPATVVEPEPQPELQYLAPAGTQLLVRVAEEVDSRQHKVGHRFSTVLEADFSHDGHVIAPRGSTAYGELVEANQAGRIKGKTWLVVRLTDIRIDDQLYSIETGDYELRGKKSAGKRTAAGTVAGAAIGAIVGGKDDRLEGAAVGAGVGLGISAIGKGEQIRIPSGTIIEFQLAQPFSKSS